MASAHDTPTLLNRYDVTGLTAYIHLYHVLKIADSNSGDEAEEENGGEKVAADLDRVG